MEYVKQNPAEKITNLAKKNYGFSREYNRLTIRPTDTLRVALRKLRKYFYKNLDAEEKYTTGHSLKEADYTCSYEKEAVQLFLKVVLVDTKNYTNLKFKDADRKGMPKITRIPADSFCDQELEYIGGERNSSRGKYTGFKDGADGAKRASYHAYKVDTSDGTLVYLFDPENKASNKMANTPAVHRYHWASNHPGWVTDLYSEGPEASFVTSFTYGNLDDVLGFYKLYNSVADEVSSRFIDTLAEGLFDKFENEPGKYMQSNAVHPEVILNAVNESLYSEREEILDTWEYLEKPEAVTFHKLEGEEKEMYAALEGKRYLNSTGDNWLLAYDLNKFEGSSLPEHCLIKEFGKEYGYANVLVMDRKHCLQYLWELKSRLFLQEYIQTVASVSLQLRALQQQEVTAHAKTYQTKKNINKETQKRMNELEHRWKDYYSGVEIDNGVDLNELSKVEDDMQRILEILPHTDNRTLPIMRFRKIHQHKAFGIFYPFNNTLAIDYRDGLQSFIHEYGHYLDFNWSKLGALSLGRKFEPILVSASKRLEQIYASGKVTVFRNKLDYFEIPSEVFALAFDIYCSRKGLDNTFIKNPDSYIHDETLVKYSCFDNCLELIDSYFDDLFPKLAYSIHDLMDTESQKVKVEGVKKSSPVQKVAPNSQKQETYTLEELAKLMVNAEKLDEHDYQLALF